MAWVTAAASLAWLGRKVRAPSDRVLGNAQAPLVAFLGRDTRRGRIVAQRRHRRAPESQKGWGAVRVKSGGKSARSTTVT